jgi:hypothetical protein
MNSAVIRFGSWIGLLLVVWIVQGCSTTGGRFKASIGSDVPDSTSPHKFTIIATAGRGGTIEPSGEIVVDIFDDVVFRFIPQELYVVDSVIIDRSKFVGRPLEYSFERVNTDHTIEVKFTMPPRGVTR